MKRLKNIGDEHKWALDTVKALRSKDFSKVDMDALIHEIGSIASGLQRELGTILRDIIEAILVMEYTTEDKTESDRQLVHAQGQLQLLLYSAPSLQHRMEKGIEKAYQRARTNVIEDYGVLLPRGTGPEVGGGTEATADSSQASRLTH